MIIDAHYHLVPKMETEDRLLEQMKRHNIDRVALIPSLNDPFHLSPFAERLSGLMRKTLISRLQGLGLFMYRTTVTRSGKFSIVGKTYRIYKTVDNGPTARLMEKHPDKFYCWILVNPKVAPAGPEIEKWAGKPGWVGVKCHPFWHRYPVSMLDDAAAICAERGMPLLIHLGGSPGEGDYRHLPQRHPKLRVMFAHAGVPFYRELWAYIKNNDNLFVDLSSPYLDEPLRAEALKALGPRKCIYGSDGPFGFPDPQDGMYDHGAILKELERALPGNADREMVLSGNFLGMISGG